MQKIEDWVPARNVIKKAPPFDDAKTKILRRTVSSMQIKTETHYIWASVFCFDHIIDHI